MIIEKEIVLGILIFFMFILWHIKMFKHFQFLKKADLIKGENYLMFLMNPFTSGYYHMVITAPLVFSKAKDINIVIAKITSVLIWMTFILIVYLYND